MLLNMLSATMAIFVSSSAVLVLAYIIQWFFYPALRISGVIGGALCAAIWTLIKTWRENSVSRQSENGHEDN